MAFPQVVDSNTSVRSSSGKDHIISLPANISEGNLLLVFFATDGDNTISDWDGFTEIFNLSNGTAASLSVAYKKATGGEGETITITTTSSEHSTHITYRITGHEDPDTQTPEVSTGITQYGDKPDPDELTPTGGAKDYLWIAVTGLDDKNTGVQSYPTDYNDNQNFLVSDSTFACTGACASRELNASSENPGEFDFVSSDLHVACTIAVHPTEGPPPPAPSTSINIGNAWKSISGTAVVKVNIGDVWKPVTAMKINIGDAWKAITIT